MEQEQFDIWMMEYVSDSLEEVERKEFEDFLHEHPMYKEQFEKLNETWGQLDGMYMAEPSEKMDDRFFTMLHSEIEKKESTGRKPLSWLSSLAEILWRPQVAYGMLLLVMGLSLGYFFNEGTANPNPVNQTQMASDSDTENVREQLVLTLLDQPSANKRLQGISEVNKIKKVDDKVIGALLQTLNNDTNVNVRLAAIESLTNYLENPTVREGLVQSIVKQDSPIVQVTLANLMVALQEKKSIEPFKTLMRSKELDTSVKQKLETSIKSII
ncbi:MAG: hypothetical protein Mars2KO_35450 [Maribacter sp.]|uniref:hypothetical protein n=1 Tax=Maribacter sp. 2307UL18-2 TaxID=3386274 RepID=UPI0039BD249D